MQFKIPQNVQREDTIVGPLTMTQLVITAIGGGITYFLYTILSRGYTWPVWAPPTFFGAVLTISFAFVKVHELTFTQYIMSGIAYILLPRKRAWIKGSGEVQTSIEEAKLTNAEKHQDDKKIHQEKAIKELDSLVKILDNKGMSKDPNKS